MYDKKMIYKEDMMDFISNKCFINDVNINFCKYYGKYLFTVKNKRLKIIDSINEEKIFEDKLSKIFNKTSIDFENTLEHIVENEFEKTYSMEEVVRLIKKDNGKTFHLVFEDKVNNYLYGDYDRSTGDVNIIDFNYQKRKDNNLIGNIMGIYSTYVEAQTIPRTYLKTDDKVTGFTTFTIVIDKKFVAKYEEMLENTKNKPKNERTLENLVYYTVIALAETNGISESENNKLAFKLLRFLDEDKIKISYIDTEEESIFTTLSKVFTHLYVKEIIENKEIVEIKKIKDFIKKDIKIFKKEREEIMTSSLLGKLIEDFNSFEWRMELKPCYRIYDEAKLNAIIDNINSLSDDKIIRIKRNAYVIN